MKIFDLKALKIHASFGARLGNVPGSSTGRLVACPLAR
jgi:hypothetical protein